MPRENKAATRSRPDRPASVWKEKELLDGKLVDAGVVILKTSGCSHYHKGGCSMCGYNYRSDRNVTPADIVRQFDSGMRELGDVAFLKLYTSGSFLDECEVPAEVAKHILTTTGGRGQRVLVETRPEYVTSAALSEMLSMNDKIEIALGLESANDRVLKYSINKGFLRADYEKTARSIGDLGIDIRTYVLLKPPFLTEAEAISDSKETVKYAAQYSKTISLNPVNVQSGTYVERLWRNWAYRPPWLWSVLDVLKSSHGLGPRVVCDPSGGGKERGAHNCGKCDATVLSSIRAYSLNQDQMSLGSPECECKDLWRTVLEMEGFLMGGTADLQRFSRPRRMRAQPNQ